MMMKRLHTNIIYGVLFLMVPIIGALLFAINTTSREDLPLKGLVIANFLIVAVFGIILRLVLQYKRVFLSKEQIFIKQLFSNKALVVIPLDKVIEIKTISILSPLTCRLVYLDDLNKARNVYFIHSLSYILVDDLGAKLGIGKDKLNYP